MLKAQDIMGLPVMEVETGKQLGVVEDLLLDKKDQLSGVLIEAKHWFSTPRYVPWEEIIAFGEDAVTVTSVDALLMWREDNRLHPLRTGEDQWFDIPVMTMNGKQLGRIQDVYFDGKVDKQIVGYELTDGFVTDLMEGRKWLPIDDKVKKGTDAIFVPIQSENKMQEIDQIFQKE